MADRVPNPRSQTLLAPPRSTCGVDSLRPEARFYPLANFRGGSPIFFLPDPARAFVEWFLQSSRFVRTLARERALLGHPCLADFCRDRRRKKRAIRGAQPLREWQGTRPSKPATSGSVPVRVPALSSSPLPLPSKTVACFAHRNLVGEIGLRRKNRVGSEPCKLHFVLQISGYRRGVQ